MYTKNSGYWDDENCARKQGRICKKLPYNTTDIPATTPLPPKGHCPEGWVHSGCYINKTLT